MLGLAVSFALFLSAPAIAAAQGDVDPLVERAVANMRAAIGRTVASAFRLIAARGEGRTLILDIELTVDTPELIGAPQVADMVAAAICSEPGVPPFFSDGRRLRVDVVRAGRAPGSMIVDHCPGPVGEGLSVGTFASGMQSIVGMETGGVRIVFIRPEGNSLIVSLDLVSGPIDAAAAEADFVAGFCFRTDVQTAFFDRGLTLRVDTAVRGRDRRTGTLIASCPGR